MKYLFPIITLFLLTSCSYTTRIEVQGDEPFWVYERQCLYGSEYYGCHNKEVLERVPVFPEKPKAVE